ncbi:MAG: ectonucleotide pyrophosphatase/phosphodiesterase [Bacillota bacterium]|nr:ectonucleotide pyrophosphatase/phosphodiesterase [Bacillota bacterium]
MRLVIISLDSVFAADSDYLLSLPNLGRLAAEGVFCGSVQTIYPSLTYPIHASLITGCYPDKHGIAHNEPFQPDTLINMRRWYWEESHIKTETIFSQAHKAGRECAAILWPTTGFSKNIRYNFPEVLALPGENQALKVINYGSKGWILRTELRYGRRRKGISQPYLDDYATLLAEKLILKHPVKIQPGLKDEKGQPKEQVVDTRSRKKRHMPDVLALHLVDCDAMRHRYGTFSKEAKEALDRLDIRVGKIMAALSERGLLKDTIVAVVTDHGQADIIGSLPLDAWLAANRVPARAQTLGFGAYLHLNHADYQPVLKALTDNMADLRISHVYTREELRLMHAPEDILLAVEPEKGFVIVDDENQIKTGATHGFGPGHPGSKTLLWLYGPQFLGGFRLPMCDLTDIAPTLAYASGLDLPQAQGRVLEEAFIWNHHSKGEGAS